MRLVCRKNRFKPSVKKYYWPLQGELLLWTIYVISVLFSYAFVRLFINALRSTAGKGLTSWLSFVMSNCEVVTFQVWCLIVSIHHLCPLSYFDILVIVVSQMNCFMNVTFGKRPSVNIKVCYFKVQNTSL